LSSSEKMGGKREEVSLFLQRVANMVDKKERESLGDVLFEVKGKRGGG